MVQHQPHLPRQNVIAFFFHSHESIVFTSDKRDKTRYSFARWVNQNGKLGH